MRHRDRPTVEVTRLLECDVETAWQLVTDIRLPLRSSAELRDVEWLDGADRVAVGARFRGHNAHAVMGTWSTECEIVEVDEGRRWVWNVGGGDGAADERSRAESVVATWGFEVEPAKGGTRIRQWARVGPGSSGLTAVIAANPEKEGAIIARRLGDWQTGMTANLDCIAESIRGR